jgi:hypothetical protein
MTDEAAKACWFPAEAYNSVGHQLKPVWGKDRTFESVDDAVTFVMEELSAIERSHASVLTPSRLLGINDIEQMYAARKE